MAAREQPAGLRHPWADPEALDAHVVVAVTGASLPWACGQADARLVALTRAGPGSALAAALADEDARTAQLVAPSAATRPSTDYVR